MNKGMSPPRKIQTGRMELVGGGTECVKLDEKDIREFLLGKWTYWLMIERLRYG